MIKILIEGDVIAAARPRFSSGGITIDEKGRVQEKKRVYLPKRNVEYQEQVSWAARQVMKDNPPLIGEICADLKIYRRYKRSSRRFGDCDNLSKNILDALNGICYVDDAQIVRCVLEKFTDKKNPRAEIEISELVSKR